MSRRNKSTSMHCNPIAVTALLVALSWCGVGRAEENFAAPGVTRLTNKKVAYQVVKEHFVRLQRGDITAIVVDNAALNLPDLPQHRAGYNGLASLTHKQQPGNLFVPGIAGLNFEHIHDGTLTVAREIFEPRKSPLELRRIDAWTVELYQPPTPQWKLESCGRYELLPDGVIEYTFECIAREPVFQQGWIGLFWASYIHAPQDRAIYFQGRSEQKGANTKWIRGVTPSHGVQSAHPPAGALPNLQFAEGFPMTLANHRSAYRHAAPWYYGRSGNMAFVQMFRQRDRMWFVQSPTGGGKTNPAWDFQWFIPDFKVNQPYGFVMRAAYLPLTDAEQIAKAIQPHLNQLNGQ